MSGADNTKTQPLHSNPSSTMDEGRFPPGTLLNQRYRVVNVIGKGGMGEVYRANDLILGQPVALKFLPKDMSQDEQILTRFRNEVRIARQVSHPNVCRVYDLSEADGYPFLSMEYVDGEDLSTLLRRIGRLPQDKGVELTRQLCAGLAAAHDKGVLHRDLKPANILINSHGQLVITDFGLAGLAEHVQADVRSGTPAYMAPEQLAGLEVTQKSDIYSLGLVLYEMFSGKRAFQGKLRDELAPIAGLVKDLDPAIEKAITRCLMAEPARRPSSALSVAAAMPGGDPLAAALAAGETPSPEMVAASGGNERLPPLHAMALIAVVVAAWFGIAAMNGRVSLLDKIPFAHSPDVLVYKAKEMLVQLGYTETPLDEASFFTVDDAYIERLNTDHGAKAWALIQDLRPSPIRFVYRASPEGLEPTRKNVVRTLEFDPPMTVPGMVTVALDSEGRLKDFRAMPKASSKARPAPFDWNEYFRLASLNPANFSTAEPRAVPAVSYDQRAAWTGRVSPNAPHSLRIEAAAFRGAPVFFRIAVDGASAPEPARIPVIAEWTSLLVMFGMTVIPWWLAWKNWSSGRGDRTGAFRFAVILAAGYLAGEAFSAHYGTLGGFMDANYFWMADAVYRGFTIGLLYFALEPHVRRRWPEMLVGWARVLSGRWKDTLVGRHLLFGLAAGMMCSLLLASRFLAEGGLRFNPVIPSMTALLSTRNQFADIAHALTVGPEMGSVLLLVFLALRSVLKRDWMAVGGAALASAGFSYVWMSSWSGAGLTFGTVAILLVCLLRFGYLAALIAFACIILNTVFPADLHFSRWYWTSNIVYVLAMAYLLAWGFHVATSGSRSTADDTSI